MEAESKSQKKQSTGIVRNNVRVAYLNLFQHSSSKSGTASLPRIPDDLFQMATSCVDTHIFITFNWDSCINRNERKADFNFCHCRTSEKVKT